MKGIVRSGPRVVTAQMNAMAAQIVAQTAVQIGHSLARLIVRKIYLMIWYNSHSPHQYQYV